MPSMIALSWPQRRLVCIRTVMRSCVQNALFCSATAVCHDKDHLLCDTHGSPSCCVHANPWPFHYSGCGSCGRWHGGVCECVCMGVTLGDSVLRNKDNVPAISQLYPFLQEWAHGCRQSPEEGLTVQTYWTGPEHSSSDSNTMLTPSMYHSVCIAAWQLISHASLYGTGSA